MSYDNNKLFIFTDLILELLSGKSINIGEKYSGSSAKTCSRVLNNVEKFLDKSTIINSDDIKIDYKKFQKSKKEKFQKYVRSDDDSQTPSSKKYEGVILRLKFADDEKVNYLVQNDKKILLEHTLNIYSKILGINDEAILTSLISPNKNNPWINVNLDNFSNNYQYPFFKDNFFLILKCIKDEQNVKVEYYGHSGFFTSLIHPIKLEYRNSDWYLLAVTLDTHEQELKTFKFSRFKTITVKDDKSTISDEMIKSIKEKTVTEKEYKKTELDIDIKIKVKNDQAYHVFDTVSRKYIQIKDEYVVAELQRKVDDELFMYLLGYGDSLISIEPEHVSNSYFNYIERTKNNFKLEDK